MTPIPLLTLELRSEQDVLSARQRARQIGQGIGLDHQNQIKFATAVSEIVRNAFRYAGGGQVTFLLEDTTPTSLTFEVVDRGPGIADLAAVLDGTYRSKTGLGLGLIGVRRLMDACDIVSAPGAGTRVTVRKWIPAVGGRGQLLTIASALAETFLRDQRNDPVAEVHQQNQELLRTLSELRARQDDLQRLNSELERSNGELSRFAHIASHDMQQPLRTIASYLGLLEMRYGPQLDDRGRSFIHRATGGAVRMATMVCDLMVDAQLRSSERTVAFFPAEAALDDVAHDLGTSISEAGASITRSPLPIVCANRARFARVLQNLISNAIKFRAPDRSPEIAIACSESDTEHRFTVADNGMGIPAESQTRIFNMFERLHSQNEIPGTGVGLATIQSIVESHGGKVGVESKVGHGSTFWFTVPRSAEGASTPAPC